ncbi:F-box/kelch-repeat protein At3g06240-like [Papaver somniferum]|uniref:F-box/kelch-repeat protein At3g06240-like n=1 Tax=Papaver somniferum TaxID=3469 RepID=UPI000E6F98BE|nr:F-box/kelch-repeat protein At3g06240-like [Papaver somniferum]
MQLKLSIQRNKPNLMLKGFHNRNGNSSLLYSIGPDLLELLLPTDAFLEYAVEIDYPFKSLGYAVELIGCCGGLVCLWFFGERLFCIWNPATGEYKVLPKSNIHCVDMVAFCYDYKSKDYKLLAGCCRLFEACSLGSNSWKTIENVPYEFHISNPSGVLVNGDLHWLAQRKGSSDVVLVSLDISNEIFKEVELPKEPSENDLVFRNLGVLKGCLCLFVVDVGVCVEVWVMQNYGVRESWTKRYIVSDKTKYLRLTWSFKNGEILFGGGYAGLYLYDSRDMLAKPNFSRLSYLYQEGCYFESLVSLTSGTYVGEEKPIEKSNTLTYSMQWENILL